MKTVFNYYEIFLPLVSVQGNYWEDGTDSYSHSIGVLAETFTNIPRSQKDVRQVLAQKTMLFALCFLTYDYLTYPGEEDPAISIKMGLMQEMKDKCIEIVDELLPDSDDDIKNAIVEDFLLRVFHIVRTLAGGEKFVISPRYPNEFFNNFISIDQSDLYREEMAKMYYRSLDEKFIYSPDKVLLPARIDAVKDIDWLPLFGSIDKVVEYIKMIFGYYSLQYTFNDNCDLGCNPQVIARGVVRKLRNKLNQSYSNASLKN